MNITFATQQGGREYQEDRLAVFKGKDFQALAVCDGLGGHPRGDEAAQACIDQLVFTISLLNFEELCLGNLKHFYNAEKATHALQTGRIWNPQPGTTLVFVAIQDNKYFALSVGDSYIFIDGTRRNTLHTRYGYLTNFLGCGADGLVGAWVETGTFKRSVVLASDGAVVNEQTVPDWDAGTLVNKAILYWKEKTNYPDNATAIVCKVE